MAACGEDPVESDDFASEKMLVDHMDPRECLKLRPKKGILKSGTSFECASPPEPAHVPDRRHSLSNKGAHFDEMNVLATHHPENKTYGHMKIDEPKTPYNRQDNNESEDESGDRVRRVSLTQGEVDPETLKTLLRDSIDAGPKVLEPGAESDDDPPETEEQREHKRAFELKRKKHYNEGQQMKLARQLVEEELKDLNTETDPSAEMTQA